MAYVLPPVNIDFVTWANQLNNYLPDYTITTPQSLEEWRDWATKLIIYNNLSNVPYPTELFYETDENWQDWAINFITSING